MNSIELFSGCGGLAWGLSAAGFTHELMVEWDADAVATVEFNKKRKLKFVHHWPMRRADVRSIDWRPFAGRTTMVAGGPPCQPFSIGGKHKGMDDPRDMWPEAIRAVREVRPQAFLFENVRGLARPAFADYLGWILAQLRHPEILRNASEPHAKHVARINATAHSDQYEVIVVKVNAADFGAPQKRHRMIIAGMRRDLGAVLRAPAPTHSRERLLWDQWVSKEYWARHGLRVPSARSIPTADRRAVERLRKVGVCPSTLPWITVRDALADLGEPTGRDGHIFQPGARSYIGHTGSSLDQPAKALKAGDHGVPGGENMMVRDGGAVRYFTIREAARLQGLPDNYQFPRSWTESMRQLGNAVPTQLAASMGRWIGGMLERRAGRAKAA